jgi:ProP effector
MQKIDNDVEVLKILKNELSACFKRGNEKLPLAIGIHESVITHYANDKRFDPRTLIKAIMFYCKGTKYLHSLIKGAARIDITGKTAGSVSESEALHAIKILASRKNRKNKN